MRKLFFILIAGLIFGGGLVTQIQAVNYPSADSINRLASCQGGLCVQANEIFAFAAVYGRLPVNPKELSDFQKAMRAAYNSFDPMASMADNGGDARWNDAKGYYYGFTQKYGHIPIADEYWEFLRSRGHTVPITDGNSYARWKFSQPPGGEGYPPSGAVAPPPTTPTSAVPVTYKDCQVGVTTQPVQGNLRPVTVSLRGLGGWVEAWIARDDGAAFTIDPAASFVTDRTTNIRSYRIARCNSGSASCSSTPAFRVPADGSYKVWCGVFQTLNINAPNPYIDDPYKCSGSPFCDYKGGSNTSCRSDGWNECSLNDNTSIAPVSIPAKTREFRIAENPNDLGIGSTAPWERYITDSMRKHYVFKDKTPGPKTIFVEFKDSNGLTERHQSVPILLLGPTPSSSPSPSSSISPARVPGDATGDRCVNTADYNCWRDGANGADFNNDGAVDLLDYTIWLDAFNSGSYVCAPGQARTQCVNQ